MTQTLYTALGALNTHQQKMNVIGNNVSNVNTAAFKRNAVHFATVYDFVLQGGMGPAGNMGGSNPQQLGTGVKTKDITTDWRQGGAQITGRSTDVMIQGNGFFVLEDPGAPEGFQITRQGSFQLDSDGNLVNAQGKHVRGSASLEENDLIARVNVPQKFQIAKNVDADNNVLGIFYAPEGLPRAQVLAASGFGPDTIIVTAEARGFSIGADGALTVNYSNGDRISVRTNAGFPDRRELVHHAYEGGSYGADTFQTGDNPYGGTIVGQTVIPVFQDMTGAQLQIQMLRIANPDGIVQDGNSLYVNGVNAGELDFGVPNTGSRGYLVNGAVESSNVDIMDEFNEMIVTQRGIEAASRLVRTQSEMLQTILAVKK